MKTQRERSEERRVKRMEEVDRQVRNGSLTIRPMTDEERKRYGPPDATRTPRPRRWR